MEYWDLYDADRNPLGRRMLRGGDAPVGGAYHLICHAWVRNTKDEIVISKRSHYKSVGAGMVEFPGGGAAPGESSLRAIIREVREEVGIDLSDAPHRLVRSFIIPDEKLGIIEDVWLFDYGGEIRLDLAETPDEVESARWMNLEEVYDLRAKGMLFRPAALYLDMIAKEIASYVPF